MKTKSKICNKGSTKVRNVSVILASVSKYFILVSKFGEIAILLSISDWGHYVKEKSYPGLSLPVNPVFCIHHIILTCNSLHVENDSHPQSPQMQKGGLALITPYNCTICRLSAKILFLSVVEVYIEVRNTL